MSKPSKPWLQKAAKLSCSSNTKFSKLLLKFNRRYLEPSSEMETLKHALHTYIFNHVTEMVT